MYYIPIFTQPPSKALVLPKWVLAFHVIATPVAYAIRSSVENFANKDDWVCSCLRKSEISGFGGARTWGGTMPGFNFGCLGFRRSLSRIHALMTDLLEVVAVGDECVEEESPREKVPRNWIVAQPEEGG
jgi:hypothetical protein